MSAMDTSNTDPADELAHDSEADLSLIAELVISHQMPTLSARRLTQLNSHRLASWCPYNIRRIAEARREDDTRDWYFPVFFGYTLTGLLTTDTQSSWSWAGIHHLLGAEIHPHPRALPPLAHLPPAWINSVHFDVVASSGGLLLIRLKPFISCDPGSTLQSNWEPLMVVNPLTKECRELPAADCEPLGISLWDYRRVQVLMVVDDAANSYKVILASIKFVCVYKSTSNRWTCRRFPRSGPWGYRKLNHNFAWGYICASAYVGGRLYFADIEVDAAANAPSVRVFQVDEEAATWQPHNQYTLPQQNFLQSPSIFRNNNSQLIKIDRCVEMVECWGELYAVIPAMITGSLIVTVDDSDARFEVMPLQFHIYQLKGAGHAHGIVRIQVPHTAGDVQGRRDSILARSSRKDWYFRNWFSCTARGSVIWLFCEDYLLQYDVATRQSTTQIIPETSQVEFTGQFSYRPSFHMKP